MNNPALNRAVIDVKATLHHDLLNITIAQLICQVPTNALEYHRLLKVTSFEADHVVAEPFDKVAFVVIDAGSVLIAAEPKERHKSAKRKRIHTP